MATHRAISPESGAERVRFRDVLRNRTFLVLYLAETQSIIGDQLARVALSILVFNRTGSAAATAATYAATFLPAMLGGALFSGLADRLPRTAVMVVLDLVRALLFGFMALPGLPIGGVVVALVLAVLVQPVFVAAEVSVLAGTLSEAQYRTANGLRQITGQVAQVGGFACGGVVVSVLHPRPALAIDAASFLLSAALVLTLIGSVCAAQRSRDHRMSIAAAVRFVAGAPTLRRLFGLSWLAGFFVVPEGLAVPYAHAAGASTAEVGLLLAAIPCGSVFGAVWVVRRRSTANRDWLIGAMAFASGVPLLGSWWSPSPAATIALWAISGFFAAYQVDVLSVVTREAPDLLRARTYGLLVSGLTGAQGLGIVVFGAVSQGTGAGKAIAIAGALGTGAAALLHVSGRGSTLGVAESSGARVVMRGAPAHRLHEKSR